MPNNPENLNVHNYAVAVYCLSIRNTRENFFNLVTNGYQVNESLISSREKSEYGDYPYRYSWETSSGNNNCPIESDDIVPCSLHDIIKKLQEENVYEIRAEKIKAGRNASIIEANRSFNKFENLQTVKFLILQDNQTILIPAECAKKLKTKSDIHNYISRYNDTYNIIYNAIANSPKPMLNKGISNHKFDIDKVKKPQKEKLKFPKI